MFLLFACQKEESSTTPAATAEEKLLRIPDGFPEMPFPEGNELTQSRWNLGKKLFYEKRLSIDQSISCGSCHNSCLILVIAVTAVATALSAVALAMTQIP